jgi:hypothetical protein
MAKPMSWLGLVFEQWLNLLSRNHYNFNHFTIDIDSGGVRASLFAANYGASI